MAVSARLIDLSVRFVAGQPAAGRRDTYLFAATVLFMDGDVDLGQQAIQYETRDDPTAGDGQAVIKGLAKEILTKRNTLQMERNLSQLFPAIKKGIEKFL